MQPNFCKALPNFYPFNRYIAGKRFATVHGRRPRDPHSDDAGIIDFVFDRMVRNRWSDLEIRCVDKEFAKDIARKYCLFLKVPETVGVLPVADSTDVQSLRKWLRPFVGRPLVAKPTHGCGSILFLDGALSEPTLIGFLEAAKHFYFTTFRETQYTHLARKIIVEHDISQVGRLDDFKFFCSRGCVLLCQVDRDRHTSHKRGLYDVPGFQNLDLTLGNHPRLRNAVDRPKQWDAMLEAARLLSEPFDYVRIDLYAIGDSDVYFGEFTLTPNAALKGFSDEAYSVTMLQRVRDRIGRRHG